MKPKNDVESGEDQLLLKEKKYQSFAKLVLMVLNICFSPFYFGYTICYLGTFTFDVVIERYSIDFVAKQTAQGLYNGCVPIGGGIGALTSFILLKKLSRKNSLLFVNILAIAFGSLLLINNQYTFLLCRLFQGICVGFYSAITPLIIKQFAPTDIAGTLGALNQLFVAFGVFFACLLQFILRKVYDGAEETYLVFMFGFTLATILIQSILLLLVYRFETPKYLLEKGEEEKCKEVLRWIYFEQYVEEVLIEKKTDLGMITTQNKQSVVSIDSMIEKKAAGRNKLRLVVAIHLAVLQQFVGINAVVIYGTQIAEKVFSNLGTLIPVILNLQQTLTSLLTSGLLMKLGRKFILQIGTLIAIVSLFLIGIGFIVRGQGEEGTATTIANVMIVGGLIVYMADFGLSLGPVVWLYIPQILEPELVSFSTLANWATATLITILFPILKNAVGQAPLFLFYAIYSTLACVFSQKYVIETKGKTQKQIYLEYENI